MSGGYFDYQEFRIADIAEEIEEVIRNNGKEKKEDDLYSWDYDSNTGEIREDSKYYYKYSDETINAFKTAVIALKTALIYAHRIDYLLEGDDDETDFHKRLKEDLEELKKMEEFWNGLG